MEILIPVNVETVAEKFKGEAVAYSKKMEQMLRDNVPKGYEFVKNVDSFAICRSGGGNEKYPNISDNILVSCYKHNGSPTYNIVAGGCNPSDLYRICGLLQILLSVDFEQIPNVKVDGGCL